MNPKNSPGSDVVARAVWSAGQSDESVHSLVHRVLQAREEHYEQAVDLGCGKGDAAIALRRLYAKYKGVDVVPYPDFPRHLDLSFVQADLEELPLPLEDASADLVVSVETIEHLENPRAFVREMVRIARPGGRIVLTTPNQLSLTSKLHLVFRNQFHAFQEAPGLYPSHISALVEEDLKRIARESGLTEIEVHFTNCGRIPFTRRRWPSVLGARGRWFSDNILLTARRPLQMEPT